MQVIRFVICMADLELDFWMKQINFSDLDWGYLGGISLSLIITSGKGRRLKANSLALKNVLYFMQPTYYTMDK